MHSRDGVIQTHDRSSGTASGGEGCVFRSRQGLMREGAEDKSLKIFLTSQCLLQTGNVESKTKVSGFCGDAFTSWSKRGKENLLSWKTTLCFIFIFLLLSILILRYHLVIFIHLFFYFYLFQSLISNQGRLHSEVWWSKSVKSCIIILKKNQFISFPDRFPQQLHFFLLTWW